MPRYKLTIEYAGTRYSGWQKQTNARTIQGELERAIAQVTGEHVIETQGSGRTDAGVHALGQVAHVDLRRSLPGETLRRRVNEELPSDINLLSVEAAPHRFHARHAALARSYVYQVARRRSAFAKAFVWWVKEPLELARMRAAADQFGGMHDFQSFSDEDPGEKSTRVLVDGVTVAEYGDLLLVRVEGSHFIWKMVRRMVGVLVQVGLGAMPIEAVAALLSGPSDVPARLTAPASGLFLERVFYEGDGRDWPLVAAVPVSSVR